jgi:hypothetical protein
MCNYSLFNFGARWAELSAPRPGRFIPGKDPVLFISEAEWAPGPVWKSAEILGPAMGFDPPTVQPVASPYTLPRHPFKVFIL